MLSDKCFANPFPGFSKCSSLVTKVLLATLLANAALIRNDVAADPSPLMLPMLAASSALSHAFARHEQLNSNNNNNDSRADTLFRRRPRPSAETTTVTPTTVMTEAGEMSSTAKENEAERRSSASTVTSLPLILDTISKDDPAVTVQQPSAGKKSDVRGSGISEKDGFLPVDAGTVAGTGASLLPPVEARMQFPGARQLYSLAAMALGGLSTPTRAPPGVVDERLVMADGLRAKFPALNGDNPHSRASTSGMSLGQSYSSEGNYDGPKYSPSYNVPPSSHHEDLRYPTGPTAGSPALYAAVPIVGSPVAEGSSSPASAPAPPAQQQENQQDTPSSPAEADEAETDYYNNDNEIEAEEDGQYAPTLFRGDLPPPPYPIRNYRDDARNPDAILGGWQNVDTEDVVNLHQTLKNNPESHNGGYYTGTLSSPSAGAGSGPNSAPNYNNDNNNNNNNNGVFNRETNNLLDALDLVDLNGGGGVPSLEDVPAVGVPPLEDVPAVGGADDDDNSNEGVGGAGVVADYTPGNDEDVDDIPAVNDDDSTISSIVNSALRTNNDDGTSVLNEDVGAGDPTVAVNDVPIPDSPIETNLDAPSSSAEFVDDPVAAEIFHHTFPQDFVPDGFKWTENDDKFHPRPSSGRQRGRENDFGQGRGPQQAPARDILDDEDDERERGQQRVPEGFHQFRGEKLPEEARELLNDFPGENNNNGQQRPLVRTFLRLFG